MNLGQAIERAQDMPLPGFALDATALDEERRANEEALGLLIAAWREAPLGSEPFPFDLVRELADRNRALCDAIGADVLRDTPGYLLARSLTPADLIRGVAKLQRRSEKAVARTAGPDANDLAMAYVEKKVTGAVIGFDIETTSRHPERGYIINLGISVMKLARGERPEKGFTAYFGLPSMYEEAGVPLSDIHGIEWEQLRGKTPFRQDRRAHEALLKAFSKLPVMAHNAAFEDSWLSLHLDGYAEARKAGKIVLVDTRDICRRIDPDVRTLPRESAPAALENWARRRGTLAADEKERHLGLEDVVLMLDTVREEFCERNMLA